MILGVAIETDSLLLAAHSGRDTEPRFRTFTIKGKTVDEGADHAGSIWEQAGDDARQFLIQAEQIVFALPARTCYLKRISIENRLIREKPDYLKWVAGNHLPGKLDDYYFDFIPLRQSFDAARTEMLLLATTSKRYDEFSRKLIAGENRNMKFIPEQIGLVQVVEKSLNSEEFAQAGIVDCRPNGILAVFARNSRFDHSRLFNNSSSKKTEIAADIETYFLSRADSSEALPLVITGFTGCFTTGWSPVVPAFMGIHNLEYAGAWGVADFVMQNLSLPGQGTAQVR
ncbi:MAG: hypothetical protein A2W25_14290 [candidate division Zixibacteria bacterium RBG_16_53_22]|nr:MAG: hypothetical protein A2W25_14290 [candidate division Zixibacteria bacterium RBG_16_53_22]